MKGCHIDLDNFVKKVCAAFAAYYPYHRKNVEYSYACLGSFDKTVDAMRFALKEGFSLAHATDCIMIDESTQTIKDKGRKNKMSEKFEFTKEAILAMAEKCPEAKAVLKAGFPAAFEGDEYFDFSKATLDFKPPSDMGSMDIQILGACGGPLFAKGLYLANDVHWTLTEMEHHWELIPTRKD